MQKTILYTSIAVLLIMHGVGLYGLTAGEESFAKQILNLTPLNLIITSICLLVNIRESHSNYFVGFFIVAITGFFTEVMGVKTGFIFGEYNYGTTMGTKLLDVPLVIGLNWGVLIFSCAAIVNQRYSGIVLKSLLGSILMLLMDFLLEPVAIQSGYWEWRWVTVPLQNYAAWFLLSFAMFLFAFKFVKNLQNDSGIWVYIVQLLFLICLNLMPC